MGHLTLIWGKSNFELSHIWVIWSIYGFDTAKVSVAARWVKKTIWLRLRLKSFSYSINRSSVTYCYYMTRSKNIPGVKSYGMSIRHKIQKEHIWLCTVILHFWRQIYKPFRLHMDVDALLTRRQYPSMRSAILSATSNDWHVIVKSSDEPATLSWRQALDVVGAFWFVTDTASPVFVLDWTRIVWIDWTWLKSAICVA